MLLGHLGREQRVGLDIVGRHLDAAEGTHADEDEVVVEDDLLDLVEAAVATAAVGDVDEHRLVGERGRRLAFFLVGFAGHHGPVIGTDARGRTPFGGEDPHRGRRGASAGAGDGCLATPQKDDSE